MEAVGQLKPEEIVLKVSNHFHLLSSPTFRLTQVSCLQSFDALIVQLGQLRQGLSDLANPGQTMGLDGHLIGGDASMMGLDGEAGFGQPPPPPPPGGMNGYGAPPPPPGPGGYGGYNGGYNAGGASPGQPRVPAYGASPHYNAQQGQGGGGYGGYGGGQQQQQQGNAQGGGGWGDEW